MPATMPPAPRSLPSWAHAAALAASSVLILALLAGYIRMGLADPLVRDARVIGRASPAPGASGVPLELAGDWSTTGGLAVPSAGAAAEVGIPAGPWDTLTLRILGDPRARWRVEWRDGHARTTWPSLAPGDTHELRGLAVDGESSAPVTLRLSPAAGAAPGALNYVDVRARASAINQVPDAGGAIILALVPWAITLALMIARGFGAHRATVIGIGIGASLAGIVLVQPSLLVHGRAVALVACMAPLAAHARLLARRDESAAALRAYAVPLALLALAFAARWEAIADLRTLDLRPDARGYSLIAREGSFYQTEQPWGPFVREPLFPAMLRLAYLVLPPTDPAARLAGALVSSLVPIVAWLVARRLLHPLAAALGAGMLAMHPAIASLGAEALRNDAITLVFLLMALSRLRLADRPHFRAAAFGACLAALALLQVTLLSFGIIVTVWEAIRTRWRPAEIFVVILPALVLVPGHLRFNRERFGSWTYSADIHVRFYANREFAGTPGYPDPAELASDPYKGGPMPVPRFLEQLGPLAMATRFAQGLATHLATGMPRQVLFPRSAWLLLPALAGAAWWVRRRDRWWFAAWNLLFMAPVALVGGAGGDWRLASTIAPWWIMLWCGGIQAAVEITAGRRGGNDPGSGSQ